MLEKLLYLYPCCSVVPTEYEIEVAKKRLEKNRPKRIVVSRHSATIEWLTQWLEGVWEGDKILLQGCDGDVVEVKASITEEEAMGNIIYGNVPLRIASVAMSVWAIDFDRAPRGTELNTLEDLERAGIKIMKYAVFSAEGC